MRSRYLKASLVVLTAAVLTISCGGGGFNGSGTFTQTVNEPPKANAGADLRRLLGSGSVSLTGASSSDPNGNSLTFSWSFELKPNSSAATLVGAATPTPSFTPDVAGLYRLTLTVNDGALSDQDRVEIDVALNAGPTPHAGTDQDVSIGATVTLDGSGSTDPDAQPLTYLWTQVPGYGPDVTGGVGTLSGVAPSFTSPAAPATLLFDLRVDDGLGASFADRVQVNVFRKPTKAVFVAPWGNDADPGSRIMPLKTLSAALAAADAIGGDVYIDTVGSFTPTATLVLLPGVSLYGGFDSSEGWRRVPAARSVVQVADSKAVAAANIAMPTEVSQLAITAASASAPGASSYGVFAVNSPGLTFRNCSITAGNAGPVEHGSTLSIPAMPGEDGSPGQPGCEGQENCGSCTLPLGGAGGLGANGGFGGSGGAPGLSRTDGLPGSPSADGTPGGQGGPHLLGNWNPGSSYWGADGANGGTGASGAVGAAAYAVTGYAPLDGENGKLGQPGKNGGGGGGGGGGIQGCDTYGGAGGGGGGGGAGGSGGGGGTSGGGSFAVFLWGSNLTLDNVVLTTGNGGKGGDGATGRAGGSGGLGGRDGTSNKGNPYGGTLQKDGSNGGRGGDGGAGGKGGQGGGGAGGPSIGIVRANGSVPVLSSVVYSLGTSGSGGSGAGGGPNGLKANTHTP